MDFRNLNTFIQVAELKSFTRAGEKLGYSQPTVSFQIKQIENELGVQLFERIGHTVTLTDRGKDVLTYAQQIMRITQELATNENRRHEASGNIRIAMADSLCSTLVTSHFVDFKKEYPKVSITITTAGTDEMFRLLDHNEVDIVCTLDNHFYNTNYIVGSEEKVGVHFVCSANNPIAKIKNIKINDLLSLPFILTEKGMSYRRMLDERLAKDSIEINPILEIGGADLICNLIEQDVGISFLPDYVTEDAVNDGKIVRLQVKGYEFELWKQLLYHRDKWMSLQLQAVINHLSKIELG